MRRNTKEMRGKYMLGKYKEMREIEEISAAGGGCGRAGQKAEQAPPLQTL